MLCWQYLSFNITSPSIRLFKMQDILKCLVSWVNWNLFPAYAYWSPAHQHNVMCVLIRRGRDSGSPWAHGGKHQESTQQEGIHLQDKVRGPRRIQHFCLDFHSHNWEKINFCHLSHPVCAIFLLWCEQSHIISPLWWKECRIILVT